MNMENKMSIDEYDERIDEMVEKAKQGHKEMLWDELDDFQFKYMYGVIENYKQTVDSKAKQYILDLLCYAINESTTGSAVVFIDEGNDVENEKIASEIDNIIHD